MLGKHAVDVWEVNRLWMYGRRIGCGYREGNRLWTYVKGTGCGCRGYEQAVDVREKRL